jgi:hypothetical protein
MKLKLMSWDKAKEMAIENGYYIDANSSIAMIDKDDVPWGKEIDVSIPTVNSEYYVSSRFNIPACCFEDYPWQIVRYGEIIDSEGDSNAMLYIISYHESIYLIRTRNDKIVIFKKIGKTI